MSQRRVHLNREYWSDQNKSHILRHILIIQYKNVCLHSKLFISQINKKVKISKIYVKISKLSQPPKLRILTLHRRIESHKLLLRIKRTLKNPFKEKLAFNQIKIVNLFQDKIIVNSLRNFMTFHQKCKNN